MSEAKPKNHLVVFVGMVELKGGKFGHGFALQSRLFESADEMRSTAAAFTLKGHKRKPRVVGGIYKVEGTVDDGKIVRVETEFSYTGDTVEPKMRAALEAHNDAVRVAERARKIEATDGQRDTLAILLQPLRKRHSMTDAIGKLALEVVLLNALRRG